MLGLGAGATAEEIKRAFREAALRTHPDRGGEDAAFIDARRAYEVAMGAGEATDAVRSGHGRQSLVVQPQVEARHLARSLSAPKSLGPRVTSR